MNVNGLWDSTIGSPTRRPITQNVSHSRWPSVSLRLECKLLPCLATASSLDSCLSCMFITMSAFTLWVPRDWDSCFSVRRVDAELCLVD